MCCVAHSLWQQLSAGKRHHFLQPYEYSTGWRPFRACSAFSVAMAGRPYASDAFSTVFWSCVHSVPACRVAMMSKISP